MAESTEGDTDVRYLGHLFPALTVLIAGLVVYPFIIGVNVTDWWKGRSVTPVDHIVTSLGISRICAQCADILHFFINPLFWRNLDMRVTPLVIGIGYDFLISTNIWLTSLLSVVFCLKISNFHTRLFLYLRGMIVPRTVYFIRASVLFSAVCSLIKLLLAITEISRGGTYNTTTDCLYMDSVYPVSIGVSFPLLSYSISSVLLFTSLYHHTIRMKTSNSLTINLETYYSAMKFVSITFIYSTVYLICYISFRFYYYVYCVIPEWLYIIMDFFSVLHSSYLMYRTAKLNSQMSKVLQTMIDFLFLIRDTETRESIEAVAL